MGWVLIYAGTDAYNIYIQEKVQLRQGRSRSDGKKGIQTRAVETRPGYVN